VTEKPFEEISDEALDRAKELIGKCSRVINAGVPIGTQNRRIKELLDLAEEQGKLK
jgi:iron complex transport system ATP-binding protein